MKISRLIRQPEIGRGAAWLRQGAGIHSTPHGPGNSQQDEQEKEFHAAIITAGFGRDSTSTC
jgi:hypothetical protein